MVSDALYCLACFDVNLRSWLRYYEGREEFQMGVACLDDEPRYNGVLGLESFAICCIPKMLAVISVKVP